FDVISVKKITSAVTVMITMSVLIPLSPINREPIHSDNPDSINPSAIAKPPPNKSKIPHGKLTAVFQSNRRSPFLLTEGIINKIIAKAIAIVPSVMPLINFDKKKERVIHEKAAKLNTIKTSFSPVEANPSFLCSSSITPLPPGKSFIFEGYATFTKQPQTINMKTHEKGTPNNIHSAKDISMPYILLTAPASNVFGGVPIRVEIPPNEAE